MRFFLPNHPTNEFENAYESISEFVGMGEPLSPRRIYKLAYKHNGKLLYAEVGQLDPINNELLIAIFYQPKRNLYLICTPNRGVIRGEPIFAGGHLALSEDFE